MDLARHCELPPCLLHFVQAVNSHWDDGNAKIVAQQTDSVSKRIELAMCCVAAFGKDKDAVTFIDRFSGVRETPAISSFAR